MSRSEDGLKNAFLVMLSIGVLAARPGVAQAAHASKVHAKASTSGHNVISKSSAKSANRAAVQSTSPAATSDAADTPGTTFIRPKHREPDARLRAAPPGGSLARRSLSAEPSIPVVRNAIGVPVVRPDFPHQAMRSNIGEPVAGRPVAGKPVVPNAPSPDTNSTGIGRPAEPNSVPTIPHPIATPSPRPNASSGAGRIDGTSLTRRSVAQSGIGGPAKGAGGINGTTLRPKH